MSARCSAPAATSSRGAIAGAMAKSAKTTKTAPAATRRRSVRVAMDRRRGSRNDNRAHEMSVTTRPSSAPRVPLAMTVNTASAAIATVAARRLPRRTIACGVSASTTAATMFGAPSQSPFKPGRSGSPCERPAIPTQSTHIDATTSAYAKPSAMGVITNTAARRRSKNASTASLDASSRARSMAVVPSQASTLKLRRDAATVAGRAVTSATSTGSTIGPRGRQSGRRSAITAQAPNTRATTACVRIWTGAEPAHAYVPQMSTINAPAATRTSQARAFAASDGRRVSPITLEERARLSRPRKSGTFWLMPHSKRLLLQPMAADRRTARHLLYRRGPWKK